MKIKNILFTGPPRCGKSTLIHKIVQKIKARSDVLLVTVTPENRDQLVNIYLADSKES